MQTKEEIVGGEKLHAIILQKEQQTLTMIAVRKEREIEYEQQIDCRWKEARSKFFNHTLKQKLSQTSITKQHQSQIVQLFMQANQERRTRGLNILLDKKGEIYRYIQSIVKLNQQLKFINQCFSRRQKEAPAINQIIQLKLTQLRVISIQYSLNIDQQYRYEVSAFELFKVVHENKNLFSVTLKGVLVKYFKQFITAIAQSKLSQIQEQETEEWRWMKDFKPLKSLKLNIDHQGYFYVNYQQQELLMLKNLIQFGEMFQQLSIISVRILLQEYKQLARQRNALQILWGQLKKISKIKIKIAGEYGCNCVDQPIFTRLLQMLSSLTTIVYLQFIYITLNPKIAINRFLVMEEVLSTIFEKNAVTQLTLINCRSFPIFPTITTLQTIYIQNISFRRQFSFMSEIAKSSPSLQSMKYSHLYQSSQEWRIEERLFSQTELLCIRQSQNVNFSISTRLPSKIKHLAIIKSNIGNAVCLSVLFPKLAHIIQLILYWIPFGRELICTIPSPHLALLQIQNNNTFTDEDLEAIDKKWPKIRQLTLRYCSNLNEDAWSACKFKGLINLQIGSEILALGHPIRRQLRGRGIKVY